MNAIVEPVQFVRAAVQRQDAPAEFSFPQSIHPYLNLLLSLLPSATLLFAWVQFNDAPVWSGVSLEAAIVMAAALWFSELTLVPLLVRCAQLLGGNSGTKSAHEDFEFVEAFAPTALMLSPLCMVVPGLLVPGIAATFLAVAMLLFLVRYENTDNDGTNTSASSWLIFCEGLIGWSAVSALLLLFS